MMTSRLVLTLVSRLAQLLVVVVLSVLEVGISFAAGPLRVHPTNPRYFTDSSGKAIYLTGSHTWDNRQDLGSNVFDYTGYLSLLQQYNHNFVRFWVWEQPKGITTSPDPAEPLATLTPELFARTGPGTAADGGLKFDVTKYNQSHFDRLRQRIIEAGNRGIYMSVMLFDGWSVAKKAGGANPWTYHPFNKDNNINGINGDSNNDGQGYETESLAIPAVTSLQEAYVRKVIDTVNDLDNVLYEIVNEADGCQNSVPWQNHLIDYIHGYEASKPKQHPVGFTVSWPCGNNADLFASRADWISPNGDGGYGDNPPAASGNKVIVTDTDHIWGIGGDRQWAWKSFTRGLNVIYMDPWEGRFIPATPNVDLRVNLGYILSYANRLNLSAMTPQPGLASSGYCLARPDSRQAEYLAYIPSGATVAALLEGLGIERSGIKRRLSFYLPSDGQVRVDLSAACGELFVEWFDPGTGERLDGGTVTGGAIRRFTAPFMGDAVLYIYQDTSRSRPFDEGGMSPGSHSLPLVLGAAAEISPIPPSSVPAIPYESCLYSLWIPE